MDWIIPVSETETDSDAFLPETAEAARRALSSCGVVLLRRVFPQTVIESLHQEYLVQFGDLSAHEMGERALAPAPNPFLKVGGKRYDITPRMDGAFADPAVFANPILRGFLSRMLGDDMRLGIFTVVVSFPGAADQHIHRDHPQLFPEGELGTVLPAYAINLAVPLVDIDLATGPTGVWPGSHRWIESRRPVAETVTEIPIQRGDCMMLDYRTLHSGLANQGGQIRPVLYMTFSRGWFFDDVNYKNRTPLNMSLDTFLGLPESVRPVVFRAYSQAIRSKQATESDLRALDRPVS